MTLVLGTQLGPYSIEAALGSGGMGEVYRARDTRLGRTVAIKVLPEGECATYESRQRFQREAQVLSSLSHPHICNIYDIGEEHGTPFIVMEYLEGETLAARLKRGPLSTAQAVQNGIQIADALDKAHRASIIHRDLKPGNIMLTKSGLKLLDFGLARITHRQPEPLISTLSGLPTRDNGLTAAGAIVGTLQYMPPEQLEGREADARTDIFALGAVLYEMATGQPAFRGQSQASLVAAILSSDPPSMLELAPMSPAALDRIVRTCLAKDPEDRWQTAHDVRLQLEWVRDAASQRSSAPSHGRRGINRELAAWTAAALALLITAALAITHRRRPSVPPPQEVRFTIDSEPERTLTYLTPISISPDGKQLVYGALDASGEPGLWLRRLDSLQVIRLEGSEAIDLNDLMFLPWTPDSHGILATINGKLLRFSAVGGATQPLCKVIGQPASVNRAGTILLTIAKSITRISADNCAPVPVAEQTAAQYDYGISWPQFLPDGTHLLVSAKRSDKRHDILLVSLDSSSADLLVRDGTYPKFIEPGFILFSRHGYLMAEKFDATHLRVVGEPFLVIKNKMVFADLGGWANFDASESTVAWKEQYDPPISLRWYNQRGQLLGTAVESAMVDLPRLAPNGKAILTDRLNQQTHTSDAWSYDLERGSWTRVTFRDAPGFTSTAWAGDSRRFIYSSLTGKYSEMYVKSVGDSTEGALLQTNQEGLKLIGDWSRDNKSVVWLLSENADGKDGIYGASFQSLNKPFFLAESKTENDLPRFSPNGQWIAYVSDTFGKADIFLRRFSSQPAAPLKASTGGGHNPRWSHDGRHLFYRTDDWKLMTMSVSGTEQLRLGKPEMIMQLPQDAEFEISNDNRFLVSSPNGRLISPLMVVANWHPEKAKSEGEKLAQRKSNPHPQPLKGEK